MEFLSPKKIRFFSKKTRLATEIPSPTQLNETITCLVSFVAIRRERERERERVAEPNCGLIDNVVERCYLREVIALIRCKNLVNAI